MSNTRDYHALRDAGPVIPYHVNHARVLGIHTSILLTQLIYWSGKHNGDWFWNTREELMRQTALTEHHYKKSLNELRELGIVLTERRGIPPKNYFYVDYEVFDKFMAEALSQHDAIGSEAPDNSGGTLPNTSYLKDTEIKDVVDTRRLVSTSEGDTKSLDEYFEPPFEEPIENLPPMIEYTSMTTYAGVYECLTEVPYMNGETTIPALTAKKIGKVVRCLRDMGVGENEGEEVIKRWQRLRLKYPKATIHALCKPDHWYQLSDAQWEVYITNEEAQRHNTARPSIGERNRTSQSNVLAAFRRGFGEDPGGTGAHGDGHGLPAIGGGPAHLDAGTQQLGAAGDGGNA